MFLVGDDYKTLDYWFWNHAEVENRGKKISQNPKHGHQWFCIEIAKY